MSNSQLLKGLIGKSVSYILSIDYFCLSLLKYNILVLNKLKCDIFNPLQQNVRNKKRLRFEFVKDLNAAFCLNSQKIQNVTFFYSSHFVVRDKKMLRFNLLVIETSHFKTEIKNYS